MAEQYLDIRIRRIPLQKNALMVTGESMTFFWKIPTISEADLGL